MLNVAGIIRTALRDNLQYGPRDFTPVVSIGGFPLALTVPARSNIHSIADLAAASKAGDGVTFATAGVGTLAQLTSVRLLKELGGRGLHVPYRGNVEGLQGIMGGQTQMMFASTVEVAPLRNEGRVRVLAVNSERRAVNMQDVRTMRELGLPEINPRLWYAYMAPAGTPAPAVGRLAASITRAVEEQGFRDTFGPLGSRRTS